MAKIITEWVIWLDAWVGWVDIDFGCCLPNFAWADGNQAEWARHLVEHVI